MDAPLILLAMPGHVFLWAALVNRVHAIGIPRFLVNFLTLAGFACMAALPVALACQAWSRPGILAALSANSPAGAAPRDGAAVAAALYVALCLVVGLGNLARLVYRRMYPASLALVDGETIRELPADTTDTTRAASADRTDLRFGAVADAATADSPEARADHASNLADRGRRHHRLTRLPGNEILRLRVVSRQLRLPRWPEPLDGLSIVHVSDLHFTGRVGKDYFRRLVAEVGALQPDLVALTGDLVDRADVLDWIAELLGPLRAAYGVYAVLGNHDRRAGDRAVRAALERAGIIDLGGRWLRVLVRGQPLILAGNELPWFVPAADLRGCPPRTAPGGPPRIALAHTPDQFDWARANECDLLLAGHTHGGQICLPLVGPLFVPSIVGVRYAAGVFGQGPTVMHVTRGVSGELPIRWNCPPEIVRLVLRCRQP